MYFESDTAEVSRRRSSPVHGSWLRPTLSVVGDRLLAHRPVRPHAAECEEVTGRLRECDADRVRADCPEPRGCLGLALRDSFGALDRTKKEHVSRPCLRTQGAVEAVNDILRGERGAVLEAETAAELEGVGLAVFRDRPRAGECGCDLEVRLVDGGEAVEHILGEFDGAVVAQGCRIERVGRVCLRDPKHTGFRLCALRGGGRGYAPCQRRREDDDAREKEYPDRAPGPKRLGIHVHFLPSFLMVVDSEATEGGSGRSDVPERD